MPALGGPVIAQPTMAGQLGQAIGNFPAQQQQFQLNQAEIDAKNMASASQRLAVLTKMLSANQGMASNPELIGATQRAFGAMGLPAPMKTVDGKSVLDTDALAAFGPANDFMSQNLSTVLALPPGSRAATIEAITGQQLPANLEGKLSALPQRTMTSNDLGPLLTTVRNSVLSLGRPGGSIGNVVATMKAINPLLEQLGTSINVDDLAPDIYAMELQYAQLHHLSAEDAKARGDADLAEARAAIQPELGQAALDKGQAAETSAAASASRANTYASLAPSTISKNNAAAAKDRAEVQDLLGTTPGGGKSAEQHLQRLTSIANQNQALFERYQQDYTTAMATAQSETDPQKQQEDMAIAEQLHEQMSQAHVTATRAQQAVDQMQRRTTQGTAPPTDMKAGTTEYYSSLTPAAKKQYLDNPNVPADVRAYLKSLP